MAKNKVVKDISVEEEKVTKKERIRTSGRNQEQSRNTNEEEVLNKFLVKRLQEEEKKARSSKVTDFDEVKKVAQANEKRRKKEQHINYLKDRIEKLQTPKARICIIAAVLVIGFFVFAALTVINDVEIDDEYLMWRS